MFSQLKSYFKWIIRCFVNDFDSEIKAYIIRTVFFPQYIILYMLYNLHLNTKSNEEMTHLPS